MMKASEKNIIKSFESLKLFKMLHNLSQLGLIFLCVVTFM